MPSSPFIKIRVQQDYGRGHTLQWWLDPNFKGKAPYKFSVSAYEDNKLLTPIFTKDVGEVTYFLDNTNIKQNLLDSYFYKISLTTDDKKVFESDFISIDADTPLRHSYLNAAEIIRKEWVRMQYTGQLSWLLKRKSYNPAATSEIDIVTGEPVIDTSSGSFGVGIAGGYYDPIILKFSLEKLDQSLDYQQEGRGANYKEEIDIRCVGFPILESQDILVTKQGKRYSITNSNQIFYPGTTITLLQNCHARIIPETDSIYKLVVPEIPDE